MTLRSRQQVTLQGVALFHAESGTAAGTLLNLAPSGCAIQSERCPSVGDYVNIALLIPGSDPVLAEVAKVRWIDEGRFGLEFLRIKQRDQVKVAHLIQRHRDETPISLLCGPSFLRNSGSRRFYRQGRWRHRR